MSAWRSILTLLLVATGLAAVGQNLPPDTVWLKDGSYYAGWVMGLVPGSHVHVRMPNSNNHMVPMTDVARISQHAELAYRNNQRDVLRQQEHQRRDTMRYRYRAKRAFYMVCLTTGFKQLRLQTASGYKFNNWAQLGATIGVDQDFGSTYANSDGFIENKGDFSYLSLPIGVYFHGDVLRSATTPYYMFEIGVAPNLGSDVTFRDAAFYSGLGIGVRFHSRGRPNFNIGLHLNLKNLDVRYYKSEYDPLSQDLNYSWVDERLTMLFLGLRIGVGF